MGKKQTRQKSHSEPEKSAGEANDIRPQIDARSKIIEILTRVETQHAYTDKLLDRQLDKFQDIDRNLITEVVNGVMRWRFRIDWYLKQLYVGDYDSLITDVRNNLRSSVYQLMYLDRVPAYAVLNEAVEIAKSRFNQKTANLVNAVLRNYLRQCKKLEYVEKELDFLERMSVNYSHPAWLIQEWIEQFGIDDTIELCIANNERPQVTVRINRLKTSPEEIHRQLDQHQIGWHAHPDFPEFLYIEKFQALRQLNLINDGLLSVQDISTGIPVLLLDPQPGETVLDMCAAPGGKTGYIAQRMQQSGTLIAVEKHFKRARSMRMHLQRLGIEEPLVIAADALKLPLKIKFDKILLDAPCSGFGVVRKRVDLKWKRTRDDIEKMRELQLKMLVSAATVLKPGGSIVYSTCTIESQENESVVQAFLSTNSDFELVSPANILPAALLWDKNCIRTFPHRHKMDGSFAAKLRHRI